MTSSEILVAVLPCNDLDLSEAFYARLGFRHGEGQEAWRDEDRILTRPGEAQLHRRKPDGSRRAAIPSASVFNAEDGVVLAAGFSGEILGSGAPEEKPWGLLESSRSDPDGALARIGQRIAEKG